MHLQIINKLNKMRLSLIILVILHTSIVSAQKFYKTSGGELIFSRPVNNSPFANSSSRLRFSAFFHFNNNYHYNFSKSVGFYSGISVSNIGFVYKTGDTIYKKRAYTVGIPLALKFGKLDNDNFLFAGGEIEIPFHYKQKKILDIHKEKYNGFFDKRVNKLLPSIFAGIQFADGYSFKFRMYLTDFLNKEFTGTDFGYRVEYKNADSQLFLLSLSYNLKSNKIKKIIKNEERFAVL